MPFSAKDSVKHKKDVPKGSQEKWAAIANSVLKSTGDEAKAIRIANGSVGSTKSRGRRK